MYTLHTFPIQQRCAHPGLCPPGQDKWTCLIRYYSYKAASSSSWGGHKAARRSNKMVIISQTEHLLGLEKMLFILNPSLFSLRHDNALVTSPSLDTLRTGSDIFFTNSSEGFCMKWSRQSWAVGFCEDKCFSGAVFRNCQTLPELDPDDRGFGVFWPDAYLRLRLGRMRCF